MRCDSLRLCPLIHQAISSNTADRVLQECVYEKPICPFFTISMKNELTLVVIREFGSELWLPFIQGRTVFDDCPMVDQPMAVF